MGKKAVTSTVVYNGTNLQNRHKPTFESLKAYVDDARKHGYRIVLTQGVFDLIHEGHARYLEMAKSMGDILIVGVDSDELTKLRKGNSRPIVPEAERIEMHAHLRHVDVIVKREAHHDIGDLIRLVEPDVLVTSLSTKDFTENMAKEYGDYCKEIITLPPQGITSTSARIRQLTIEGAESLAEKISALTAEFLENIRNAK